MGSIALPKKGTVYADTQILIYSVERHPHFESLLRPLWSAVQADMLTVVTSDLALMETLVGPLKRGLSEVSEAHENLFVQPGVRLEPLTRPILRVAAQLRATTRLRTPDAIHAATAMLSRCDLFITNDRGFLGTMKCPIVILGDLLTA